MKNSTTILRERLYATLLAIVVVALFSAGAFARALEIRGFAITVSDMDRSVEFFERALDFKKVSERTIVDRNYDYLTGVFGTRVRNVQLKLGDEMIELEQYLSPTGQPIPHRQPIQ